jgi:hypothetical protein
LIPWLKRLSGRIAATLELFLALGGSILMNTAVSPLTVGYLWQLMNQKSLAKHRRFVANR